MQRLRFLLIITALVIAFGLQTIPTQAYSVGGWNRIYEGVHYATGYVTSPRMMRAFALRIDLHNPNVSVYNSHDNGAAAYEVALQTTPAFLSEHGMEAAVNSCYFDAGLSPNTNIEGLLISNGALVSSWQAARQSELLVTASKIASIVYATGNPSGIYNACSGDAYLLQNGTPVGDNTDPQPRTTAGLSDDGRYIYLVCVDGRQPGWSDGATIYDMGLWQQSFGAYNAINLDGGGSTTMSISGMGSYVNRPCYGYARSVGASFGVNSRSVMYFAARPAVFRTVRSWYLRNTLTTGGADLSFEYGAGGDIPVMGDWDGNGTITCGIVRNESGQLGWHLNNSNSGGTGDINFVYGVAGDIPIVGDWDGDRVWTPGIIREVQWNLRNTNTSGTADL